MQDADVLAVPAGRGAVDPFLAVSCPDNTHTDCDAVRTVVEAPRDIGRRPRLIEDVLEAVGVMRDAVVVATCHGRHVTAVR